MRTAVPYGAVNPDAVDPNAPVVGTAPTLASRQTHGNGYWDGIDIAGTKALSVPIMQPVAGNGLGAHPAFPFWQGSVAAAAVTGGSIIRPPVLVTQNRLQPVSHAEARFKFSQLIPVPTRPPDTRRPTQNNSSRRPSASPFTIPYPLTGMEWPTSSQWLADHVRSRVF